MKTNTSTPNVGSPVELWGPGNVWHEWAGTITGYVNHDGARLAVIKRAHAGAGKADGVTLLVHPDNLRPSWRGII